MLLLAVSVPEIVSCSFRSEKTPVVTPISISFCTLDVGFEVFEVRLQRKEEKAVFGRKDWNLRPRISRRARQLLRVLI